MVFIIWTQVSAYGKYQIVWIKPEIQKQKIAYQSRLKQNIVMTYMCIAIFIIKIRYPVSPYWTVKELLPDPGSPDCYPA